MNNQIDINITNGEYKNYIGKQSLAMINSSNDDFTIIFENKKDIDENAVIQTVSDDELYIPLLIENYEESIKLAIPNCRILYNNVLNIETLLTGLIIGKIFRNEDISKFIELLKNRIEDIYNNKELRTKLEPLLDEAQIADDYDFSRIEDSMYMIIEDELNKLL